MTFRLSVSLAIAVALLLAACGETRTQSADVILTAPITDRPRLSEDLHEFARAEGLKFTVSKLNSNNGPAEAYRLIGPTSEIAVVDPDSGGHFRAYFYRSSTETDVEAIEAVSRRFAESVRGTWLAAPAS